VNGMDRHLRDLLDAAVGEPPHQVTAAAVRRRVIRRRVVEAVAGAMAVVVIAALALVGVRTIGHGHPPAPATRPHPTARIIISRHYHYAEALPAGWRLAGQATQQWDGTGSPGNGDSVVDLFLGPGGVEAWALAAPTKENLAAYTRTVIRASNAVHGCPAVTQPSQAITIGGAPARLLAFECGAGSGFVVEIAVTVHGGTAFVFASQPPAWTRSNATDRAAFREFLAGIQLRR
jgi:hypothetical protein